MGIIHDVLCVPIELYLVCQCGSPGYCQRQSIWGIYTGLALSVLKELV